MTLANVSSESINRTALRLVLNGRVQGVGMRPAIARVASRLKLAGFVRNTSQGVELHVEGPMEAVDLFVKELAKSYPLGAEVTASLAVRDDPTGATSFVIDPRSDDAADAVETSLPKSVGPLSARVPADVVVCSECRTEVMESGDRRQGYPFTSCANCGPRYSIIERMPFERDSTSMTQFWLCDGCREEYRSSDDRRFHAQTNACSACGPAFWLCDASERVLASREAAIPAAAVAIKRGEVVALRGLGGYQLLVDATSQQAVERLRQRKRRHGKPLPVMVASIADALFISEMNAAEQNLLCGPEGPIVIVSVRGDSPLANSVSDGLNTVGLMLPTTPLHQLLLETVRRPLVCTSGNVEGEPLAFEMSDAHCQLREVADVWLEHDRPIRRPIDDSVLRVMCGRPVAMRLARGFAPLALSLGCDEPLVALGGEQKGSVALCNGEQSVLGPHLGDYKTIVMRERFTQQMAEFASLYGVASEGDSPSPLVCDQHPEYFTTRWAEERGEIVIPVQHHQAHIVAGMVEQGWLDREVLGVAWDGTGHGSDGTIWGGEFLRTTATGFQRVAHLRSFRLPGGEAAIRQPCRVATALVADAMGDNVAARLTFQFGDARSLLHLLRRPTLSPLTTSAGRLFEGIAALVLRGDEIGTNSIGTSSNGGVEVCRFEGEAAMRLEAACDLAAEGQYELSIEPGPAHQLDWRPLVRQVMRDGERGVPVGTIAMRVHRGLAAGIVAICQQYRELPVILGGGVFQNRVLVELLAERFAAARQSVGLPGLIPPNDGGLAVGQLAVASAVLRQQRSKVCV